MKPFEILTSDELAALHAATLRVLAETGLLVKHPETRARLTARGCAVEGERVLIPAGLIDDALKTAPRSFTLHGRDPKYDCPLVEGAHYTLSTTGAPFVIDLDTGVRRAVLAQDVADLTRLCDALPYVHMTSPATPKDVEPEIVSPVRVALMFRNTTKPMRVAVESGTEVRYILEVAAAVHGGRDALREKPQLQLSVSPMSPLTLSPEATEAIVEVATAGMPLGLIPAPIVGATGPMSLAGSLVQQNAEILGGIVIAQVVNAGTPVVYEPRLTVMDMRTGQSIWGNPEVALTHAAGVQIGRYYGLPTSAISFGSSAKGMDAQDGYERAFDLLGTILAGANVLGSLGSADNVVHTAYELMVLDDELTSWAFRFVRGFRTDEDALGVAAIQEAVSNEGNFLALRHTRDFMRAGEVWTPALSDRLNFEDWEAQGRPTTADRARARAREILATHTVEPLPADVDREVDEIIAAARAALTGA